MTDVRELMTRCFGEWFDAYAPEAPLDQFAMADFGQALARFCVEYAASTREP